MCKIRPPRAKLEWIDIFYRLLNVPYGSTHDITVMGDFNTDMSRPNASNRNWNNTAHHFNLHHFVKSVTRVAEN